MSIEDKRKAAFEDYAIQHPYLREIGFKRNSSHPDEYDDPELDLAWEAWNAALDSVVIELPSAWAASMLDSDQVLQDCRYAIESTGLKVKS